MRVLTLMLFAFLLPTGTAGAQDLGGGPGFGIRRGYPASRRATPRTRAPRVDVRYNRRLPVVRHRHGRVHYRGHRSHGYWRTIRERIWVAPVYEYRRDACGRYYRVLITPGCYRYVTRRVYVRY